MHDSTKKFLINSFAIVSLLILSLGTLAQQSSAQYRLGSGDVIKISVFGEQELSMQSRIPSSGIVNYPFLGELNVIGLTTAGLERLIYSGLKGDYLISPSVAVTIDEYRPFFIDGEVKRPGGYPYQPGLSITKAVALAGGFTDRATKGNVMIIRNIDGMQTSFTLKTSEQVMPGDFITVQQSLF